MPAILAAFASFLLLVVGGFFVALWLLGTDLGAWLFEQMLDIAITVLNSISFDSATFNPGSYVSALPAELVNVLGLLRVGECIAIIAAACVVKLLLQLVPFTRLGS